MPIRRRSTPIFFAVIVVWSWGLGPILLAAPDVDEDEPGLVARLRGHLGSGACASFSRDGRRILTAGHHSAWLWDGATYQRLTPPMAHENVIYTAEFSRDGSKVITASADGTAGVWDAKTGNRLMTLRHGEYVVHAAFSPDANRAVTCATAHEPEAKVWDVATGRLVLELRHDTGVQTAEFSPDGKRILTTTTDERARLWDAGTGERLHTLSLGRNDFGGAAAFSPDGTKVVTGNYRRDELIACVWEVDTGKLLATTEGHWSRITSIVFSPEGKRFATTADGSARVWDTASGKAVTRKLGDGVSMLHAAAFSPDGSLLSAVGEGGQADVWEVATGKKVVDLGVCDAYVDTSFSPDGKRVLTACYVEGFIMVWDVEARRKAFEE